ncbi:unnamed protein product [Paramecium sonneborni]|uniref:Uncharacterized protein n=1 Tax=Paramecium sonneborni TaxID=65129 RepID=A0A8S1R630_9CILI|nr:unnamed protein product [Paramecium sonneborni]
MGACCSNKNSNKIIKNPYADQDDYEELSGEMKEILELYLNCERNSPQNKNLAESNQLKHSLEQPNTPYFKNSFDCDDKFQQLKQSKQVEEKRSSHKNSEKLPPVEEENEQQRQYEQSDHPIFQYKCLICQNDHKWIHTCNQELMYNEDNMIVCEKCKFKQKITEYDFICQKTQQKFRFTTEQIKDLEL